MSIKHFVALVHRLIPSFWEIFVKSLNGKCDAENWLENLLVSDSMNGVEQESTESVITRKIHT